MPTRAYFKISIWKDFITNFDNITCVVAPCDNTIALISF